LWYAVLKAVRVSIQITEGAPEVQAAEVAAAVVGEVFVLPLASVVAVAAAG
jgi:hypothetical protein